MTGLLLKALLLSFLLVVFSHEATGQAPVLEIFGPSREAVYVVSVGSGMPYELSLFNNITAVTLTGNVSSVVVTINGGSDNPLLETVTSRAPSNTTLSLDISATNDVYTFQLAASGSGVIQTNDYRFLIGNFLYVSNLSTDTLSDPPRNLTIVAVGPGGASQPATAMLQLLMANQQPPVIASRITASVDEGELNGALVVQLSAQDPENQAVVFSLISSSLTFSVSPSGAITVADSSLLDYEITAQRLFTLQVAAADTDPVSPMTSQTTVTINVVNVNDNAPMFTSNIFNFSVTEAVPDAVVGTLTATDRDLEDPFGRLFYDFSNLVPGGIIQQRFQINRITGVITARAPGLDFESTQSYSFNVGVSDGLFGDTAVVNVMVIDAPDDRPIISPATKTILVDLDGGQREVFLTSGSGGMLTVSDSDSPVLRGGVATTLAVTGSQVRS